MKSDSRSRFNAALPAEGSANQWGRKAAERNRAMAMDKDKPGTKQPPRHGEASAVPSPHKPDWADGLRALYDSVVDEPLPDSFKDLLNRLDDPSVNGSS